MYLLIGLNIILKRSRNCLLYTEKETNGRVVIVNTWLYYINLTGNVLNENTVIIEGI